MTSPSPAFHVCLRLFPFPVLVGVLAAGVSAALGGAHGLRVPSGFEVALYAGDDLTRDIHAMTIDHLGRVVVGMPGAVKILHDRDGDGRAEAATTFVEFPKSGAQGMYFDAEGLVVAGDQGVRRWRDRDGDGRAEAPDELLLRAGQGEHGAHGIVKGPDGWLYLMAGNEAGIGPEHATLPSSPIRQPVAGTVVRFSLDGKRSEVIAHGFRNAYDLDFHASGQLLTYDSDGERDHHLPWYAETRLFDLSIGGEHGWILRRTPHAWSRPEAWFDNTPRLAVLGRGSPAGVVMYRHHAFPARYRDGLFAACWTLGRIYFAPLALAGATFRTEVETFLEVDGTHGFAPVDLAVGPDGDLFIAIGGRGTVGRVYRVRPTTPGAKPAEPEALRRVLQADQPLASWSRARWVPAADALGREAFARAATDERLPPAERVRAIEILVERFGGLDAALAEKLARSSVADVRARAAWALPRSPEITDAAQRLARLTREQDPAVARGAWEGLLSLPPDASRNHAPDWYGGIGAEDRRVRAATWLAARRTGASEFANVPLPEQPTTRQQLGRLAILGFGSEARAQGRFVETCLAVLRSPVAFELRHDAVRLLQRALGDVVVAPARPDAWDGFVAASLDAMPDTVRAEAARQVASAFPSGDAALDRELARLLAMLAVEVPGLVDRLLAQVSSESSVEDDLHTLMAVARLPGSRSDVATQRSAEAVAALPRKMRQGGREPSRYWGFHVGEMFARLVARDAGLLDAFFRAPSFGFAEHALLLVRLPAERKPVAAEALLARDPPSATWTSEFIELLGVLPDSTRKTALRAGWSHAPLRDRLVPGLALAPEEQDRARFVEALGSFQAATVERAAVSLRQLAATQDVAAHEAAIRALRRLCQAPAAKSGRAALATLLQYWSGLSLATPEQGNLLASYAPWFEWFERTHAAQRPISEGSDDLAQWRPRLARIDWAAGDAARGRQIYEQRLCAGCHLGTRSGPDLTGITSRFNRDDLFTAILAPDRDISPLWQGMKFTMKDGTVHVGTIVYESPTATVIQTGPDQTLRLIGTDVKSIEPSRQSLMPPGLLNGLADADVADLYSYLGTLRR